MICLRWLRAYGFALLFAVVTPVAIYLLAIEEQRYANATFPLLLGAVFGELALCAMWAALGSARWWWRLPTAALPVVGVWWIGHVLMYEDRLVPEFFFGLPFAAWIVILLIVRGCLGPIRHVSVRDGAHRFQFSLGQLLVATLVVAIFVALAKYRWKDYSTIPSWADYAKMMATMTTAGIFSFGLVLVRRWVAFYFLVAALLGTSTGLLSIYLLGHDWLFLHLWHFCGINGTGTGVILVTLSAARWAGYRPRSAHETTIDPAVDPANASANASDNASDNDSADD